MYTLDTMLDKKNIAMKLSKCKIYFAALSELRLTGSGMLTVQPPAMDETMMLFYSDGGKRETGVGFMVDRQAARSVIAFQPISDRLNVQTKTQQLFSTNLRNNTKPEQGIYLTK